MKDVGHGQIMERIAQSLETIAESQARLVAIAEYDHALIRMQFEGPQVVTGPCDHPVEHRSYHEQGAHLRIDCEKCGTVGIQGTGERVA